MQLGSLGLLRGPGGLQYLTASALAVELAVLHNFAWHWQFTWQERFHSERVLPTLVRFHLSNGFVSTLGNLVVMKLLVGVLGYPVIVSNSLSILLCSGLNFLLADRWGVWT